MLCSNCGYENPSEHRYCGMCGTPFPHRALTVPGAQSTLDFIKASVKVLPDVGSEPAHEAAVEAETFVQELVAAQRVEAEPEERAAVVAEASAVVEDVAEAQPVAAAHEVPALEEHVSAASEAPLASLPEVSAAAEVVEHLAVEPAPVPHAEAVAEPTKPPALATVGEAELAAEPSIVEAEVIAGASIIENEPVAEMLLVEAEAKATEVIGEPSPEPKERPTATPAEEPEVAEVTTPLAPRQPAPRVLVMPPRQSAAPPAPEVSAQELARVHPPPDSLPLTSPPASSGMPTFKEVSAASGPPTISLFEPPKVSHTSEDRELEEFVAGFRWTPPAETADELTMRSEVPVIDKEAPAEFHHPSFDGDEAPPPQAGPHPTGKEYYAADGTAPGSRFLDVGKPASSTPSYPVGSGSSILGLDATPSVIPPEELARTSRRRWLWGSIVAVVAIFGGLGYWEGRAQSNHEFRGPVEIAREGYVNGRQWLRMKVESLTASSQSPATEVPKLAEPEKQPETTAQPVNSDATSAQQNAAENTSAQPKDAPVAGETQSADTATGSEPTTTAPPKPLEVPLPKLSTKPQPGQQELAKAMQASDAAATAAWLWKSTSRGNPDAPVRLADMYIRGNGVPKSCEQALVLLRAAAMKENAPARNRLAALYANGTCVARDPVKAYQLMSSAMAVDPASDWAKENRQVLWNQMTPQQRAEAEKAH